MTLYLKYRPQTIGDLDLKAVRDSLQRTLSKEDIPHAFLFAGPKGTGKTSAARILAKALNCEDGSRFTVDSSQRKEIEPCNTCSSCISITRGENLDVIEIDAASHRGIDDIRMLREAVKLAPVSAKKKVYIIDEAHMLTTEACNALLKVLEEPPSHVVFILATTNPEKLIDTIRSRTTLVQFTKATEEDVTNRLLKISASENITVNDDVLKIIAHGADGAFRDGVKLFEQLISEQVELSKEGVTDFLFGNKSFDPEVFLTKLEAKDTKGALELVEHGCEQGLSAKNIAKGVLDLLRKKMLTEVGRKKETIELLELFSKAYSEIPNAYLEQLPLEIAVVKWCDGSSQLTVESSREGKEKQIAQGKSQIEEKRGETPAGDDKLKKVETAPAIGKSSQFTVDSSQEGKGMRSAKIEEEEGNKRQMPDQVRHDNVSKAESEMPMAKNADTVVSRVAFSEEIWAKVLTEVRPRNSSTEALLRSSKPIMFDGKILTVGVFYKFHKERLEAAPHRDLLEEILQMLMGQPVRIACTLTEPPQKVVQEEVVQHAEVVLTETKQDDKIVDIAKEIFGS